MRQATFSFLIGVLVVSACWSQVAAFARPDVPVEPKTRTVTTSNFSVSWNTGADTEAITSLAWMGSSNLTDTYELGTCGDSGGGNVQYFGNGWAPPDPQSGGFVLVGGGTITPPGTAAWSGEVLPAGTIEVTINSNSTSCPPTSVGIDVQTTYRFFDSQDPSVNWFEVERVYDFSSTIFAHDLRPYIARLNMGSGYTQVLYPAGTDLLAIINAADCDLGCTGPVSAPGAAPLYPAWDSQQGWFAFQDPATQEGVVVMRHPSADPHGSPLTAQLWVDYDGPDGSYDTNASSFLLLSPTGGFTGGLLTEAETFCFYNSSIWTPSLTPPTGCRNAPMDLSPWTLTFAGRPVGSPSPARKATLTNSSGGPVTIKSISANGDFAELDDCPRSLAAGAACTINVTFTPTGGGIRSGSVSILDLLDSSPQVLNLAGLGVVSQ